MVKLHQQEVEGLCGLFKLEVYNHIGKQGFTIPWKKCRQDIDVSSGSSCQLLLMNLYLGVCHHMTPAATTLTVT